MRNIFDIDYNSDMKIAALGLYALLQDPSDADRSNDQTGNVDSWPDEAHTDMLHVSANFNLSSSLQEPPRFCVERMSECELCT